VARAITEVILCGAAAWCLLDGALSAGRRMLRAAQRLPAALSAAGEAAVYPLDWYTAWRLVRALQHRPQQEPGPGGPFAPAPEPARVDESMLALSDDTAVQLAAVRRYIPAREAR
jgi:hypothetical protein